MVRKVVWTDPAKERLREITNYLRREAGARTANKIRDAISSRPEILVTNPLAGPREGSLEKYPDGFRYLVEGNYKIIYFVVDTEIVISTVFDCRRDPARLPDEVR
jgi:plasmid stabilization system protein ParE